MATHALAIVGKLKDSNEGVRQAAMKALAKLPAEAFAADAPAIVGRLELPAEAFAANAPAIVGMLEDSNSGVRHAAVKTPAKLPDDAFADHAEAIVGMLEGEQESQFSATDDYKLDVKLLLTEALRRRRGA